MTLAVLVEQIIESKIGEYEHEFIGYVVRWLELSTDRMQNTGSITVECSTSSRP